MYGSFIGFIKDCITFQHTKSVIDLQVQIISSARKLILAQNWETIRIEPQESILNIETDLLKPVRPSLPLCSMIITCFSPRSFLSPRHIEGWCTDRSATMFPDLASSSSDLCSRKSLINHYLQFLLPLKSLNQHINSKN